MTGSQNYINHVALVLDASSSMYHLRKKVIEVADEQIAYLARRSKELDQETRVTVYVFADKVECVIYDKDVLRLPSISTYYDLNGMTALLAATLKSQRELAQTAQLYGDHSFLTFVLTDGQENASAGYGEFRGRTPRQLVQEVSSMIESQAPNWTLAVLVPDQMGKREAMMCGFPKDNIALWDATSTQGLEEASHTIRQATENFMVGRTKGIRGTKSLFSTGSEAVNAQTVKANLTPLSPTSYHLVHVTGDSVAQYPKSRDWVEQEAGLKFRLGCVYYELTKTETIQPQKQIAVMEKKTGRVYSGPEARDLIGLPDMTVKVKPDHNPDFSVFVQSTSTNRKLVPNTKVMLIP